MTLEEFVPSKEKVEIFTNSYFKKINSIFYYGLLVFYFLGIAIAFYYENLLLAVVMGAINLAIFYISKAVFPPSSSINKHMASISMAMFYLQFTIQSYGDFYIRFVFFLSMTALILFQDWKVLFSFYITGMLINLGKIIFDFTGLLDQDTVFYTQAVYNEITPGEWLIAFSFAFIQFLISVLSASYLRKQTLKNAKNALYLQEQLNVEANTQLAYDITHGQLDTPYELNENDAMGKALVEMRDNLKNIREQNRVSQWLNAGAAEISEILINSNSIEELSENVLQKIVKYMNAQQATFYVLNKEQLEMTGAYGCSAQLKESNRIFQIGEGVIGEVAQQKETFLIENPPEDFVSISSGLGEAKPMSIIVVPLKFQENMQGVLEVASFKSFKKYEQEFLESVSEKIATSLNSVKSKYRTNQLLKDAQVLNEQLKSQEEEMKVNMEMMAQTQNEIARINAEMEGTLAAINLSFISVEMDGKGTIKNLNKNWVEATGLSLKDLEKTTFDTLFSSLEDSAFWQDVLQHKNCNEEFSLKGKDNKEIWVRGIFTTIKNRKDANEKILLLGYDVTEEKLSSIKLEASFEQTRKQTEQLKDQEEEMHANMEILQMAVKQSEEKANSLQQLLQQKEEEIKALQANQKTKTNNKKSTSRKRS